MVLSPDAQQRMPNQENMFLEYVQRLERHRESRAAVHLHLSELQAVNRREQHLRAAANNFEPMIESMEGQLKSIIVCVPKFKKYASCSVMTPCSTKG